MKHSNTFCPPFPSPLVKLTVPPLISNEGGKGGEKDEKDGRGGECRIGQALPDTTHFRSKNSHLVLHNCINNLERSLFNLVAHYEDFSIQSCSIIP